MALIRRNRLVLINLLNSLSRMANTSRDFLLKLVTLQYPINPVICFAGRGEPPFGEGLWDINSVAGSLMLLQYF